MRILIKILSIITLVWTSLAVINCFYLIGIVINSFSNYYRNYEEDLFIFGAIGLLQTFGIIILVGFLVSLWGLDRNNKPVEIE